MKLSIKESMSGFTRINAKMRKQLNKVAAQFSKWMTPKEASEFFDVLQREYNVHVPAWDSWDEENSHPYYIDGMEVENSRLVYQVYKGTNSDKNEYNIYFS